MESTMPHAQLVPSKPLSHPMTWRFSLQLTAAIRGCALELRIIANANVGVDRYEPGASGTSWSCP